VGGRNRNFPAEPLRGDVAARTHGQGTLQVARIVERTSVLGPGIRTVIWVQGCPLRCRGCIAPEALDFDGGLRLQIEDVARRILSVAPAIDGVTYSGGEPFSQAGALATLTDRLRSVRPEISVMSFSGFTREWLETRGDLDQGALLTRLDLLVDGPYVQRQHASLRWRGSSNQRLHRLSSRHSPSELAPDRSAGVELEVLPDASIGFVGVPEAPGFREAISESLIDRGLTLT
jgi:anaerobic ribonucleoside-triphosphate reductase activating protein